MTDEIKKDDPRLFSNRLKNAEYERTLWVANVEVGITREHLKNPSFWSHIANKLRPYDRIEVRPDDGTFIAEFVVLACDRTWAKVHELSYILLTTSDISQTQAAMQNRDYEVKFRGPQHKWTVIRKSDAAVLKAECQTKEEADFWLKEHRKTVEA